MTTEPNRQPEGIPVGGQFAKKTQSDDVVALATPPSPAPKIMASVTLQQWGGHKNDYAIAIETLDFDAAPVLAAMSPEARGALEDSEADDIYLSAVRLGLIKDHDGPFDVHVREALDFALDEDPELFEKFAAAPECRPATAVLDEPLSAYELGARADEDGFVTGLAAMDMSDLIDNDLDQHNDAIGESLVGSCLLMQTSATPVDVKDGRIIMKLEGDASAIIEGFDEDELAQYEAGRAARTTEGA